MNEEDVNFMKEIDLRPISAETPLDELERFYAIMIHAYAVTEAEIWGESYARMSWEEFFQLSKADGMLGVWIDGAPVGSIHLKQVTPTLFSFGLLSVDFRFKGMHLGRTLIAAAEALAKKRGGTHIMLELLRLEHEELPFKKRLREWYESLGYRYAETVSFRRVEPDKQEKEKTLLKPSVFDCYEKPLS